MEDGGVREPPPRVLRLEPQTLLLGPLPPVTPLLQRCVSPDPLQSPFLGAPNSVLLFTSPFPHPLAQSKFTPSVYSTTQGLLGPDAPAGHLPGDSDSSWPLPLGFSLSLQQAPTPQGNSSH